MLRVRVALAIAAGGVAAFTVGLVLLLVAADPDAVDAALATAARQVLSVGVVATVVGMALLARFTVPRE